MIWYGLDASVGVQGNVDLSDAGTCPLCGSPYEYDFHIYAHLGGFRCTGCSYKRQVPDVRVVSIDKKSTDSSIASMRPSGSEASTST